MCFWFNSKYTVYVMLRSAACVYFSICVMTMKSTYTSPVTRRKCWQLLFLHTTDVFTSVDVIGYIPNWNRYKMCHITFTLNVYDLTFIFWRRRGLCCQANDRSSRLHFNICKCDITGYYLRRPQDNFQLCLFWWKTNISGSNLGHSRALSVANTYFIPNHKKKLNQPLCHNPTGY